MSALAAAADMSQPLLVQGQAPAGSSGGAAPPVSASPQLLGLCCALSVLRELQGVAPPRWVAGTMTHVVKALNRCSREVAQPPAGPNHQAHYQALSGAAAAKKQQAAAQAAAAARAAAKEGGADKDKEKEKEKARRQSEVADKAAAAAAAAAAATEEEPEYGTVTWAIYSALGLAGTLLPGFNPEAPQGVIEDPVLAASKDESKRMLLQSLILLLTGSGAKWTDASLFTQVRAACMRMRGVLHACMGFY